MLRRTGYLLVLSLSACGSFGATHDPEAAEQAPPRDGGGAGEGAGEGGAAGGPPADAGGAGVPLCDASVCPRTVFVSSRTFAVADLGGVDGADQRCAELASTNPSLAGRSHFAWLSTGARAAKDRLIEDGRPLATVAGARVATGVADLLDGTLEAPIADESGKAVVAGDLVWTGTNTNGSTSHYRCLDWTSTSSSETARTGTTGLVDARWGQDGQLSCDAVARIYCFER